jgi:hypothetical protein
MIDGADYAVFKTKILSIEDLLFEQFLIPIYYKLYVFCPAISFAVA